MSDYDPTDFVDDDFQARKTPLATAAGGTGGSERAPSRDEVDSKVVKRAQQDLERERAALEETRRRQMEFQTGRQELIHSLTRGLGLLEESEFNARRDAEQMAKTLAELRDALEKMQSIHEEAWTKDSFSVELTRALTAVENARMEWNSARLKFPLLSGQREADGEADRAGNREPEALLRGRSFGALCALGLALTLPVVLTLLLSLGVALALFLRR